MVRIKVINKDNNFGGRIIDISFGDEGFKTPYRASIHKEYLYKSSLPHDIKFRNKISDIVSNYNNSHLDGFLKGNGSFKRRKNEIDNQFVHLMRHSKSISSIVFPRGRTVSIDELMLFLSLQDNPELKVISIPPFNYKDIEEFNKVIIDFKEVAKSRNQEIMTILPIAKDLAIFRKEFAALRELRERDVCKIIGFQFAPPQNYIQQYLEIYKNREFDLWYHCIDIPRTQRKSNLAEIHKLQNWGLDTFSIKTIRLTQPQAVSLIMRSKGIKFKDLKVNRFDSPTLGVLKEPEYIRKYSHELHCVCPICKGKDLISFKKDYSYELNGDFNPSLLLKADKVHDLISSTEEFEISRDSIKSDDLPSYFEKKEFSKDIITPPS